MNRRQILGAMTTFGLSGSVFGGWKYWPEQSLRNPCLAELPKDIAQHTLMLSVWSGLELAQVWDCHVHMVGEGDANGGAWFSPAMDSLWHPVLHLKKLFYMNAACVNEAPGHLDQSYVARMLNLVGGMPRGFKAMLFAVDWFNDESGQAHRDRSIFYIPNSYAAQVAHSYPNACEWVASIHPYRPDCVEHPRLLNGSDYPLPGVMPLFSVTEMVDMGLLDPIALPILQVARTHNPLLFDFALKRLLRFGPYQFPSSVFDTRRSFKRTSA